MWLDRVYRMSISCIFAALWFRSLNNRNYDGLTDVCDVCIPVQSPCLHMATRVLTASDGIAETPRVVGSPQLTD